LIVTIHQPNFLPWLPYFKKIQQADVFVFLRHCQYQREGHQHRFQRLDKWHTMKADKGHLQDSIFVKKYIRPDEDWQKIKQQTLEHKALLDSLDFAISSSLHETNQKIILMMMQKMNITTKVEYDVPDVSSGTERLVNICKDLGATTYLSGPSGRHYMDLTLFENAGINVEFFEANPDDKIHSLDALTKERQ